MRPQLKTSEPVSILQPWVSQLLIRQQGTLLAAIRGCDGVGEEGMMKMKWKGQKGKLISSGAEFG